MTSSFPGSEAVFYIHGKNASRSFKAFIFKLYPQNKPASSNYLKPERGVTSKEIRDGSNFIFAKIESSLIL